MGEVIAAAIHTISRAMWGPWTIAFFLGMGVYLSMRCEWMQIRHISLWMRESVGKYVNKKARGDLSGLKSVCTILAATLGTGNLVGVATALIAGGPGAVFWMWIAAGVGMMTAYAENVLGVLYARKDIPGPMAYIRTIPMGRWLSKFYACCCLFCGLAMGNLTQSNTAASALESAFGLPRLVSAVLLILMLGAVFSGGRKMLGKVALFVTPCMTALFLVSALAILAMNLEQIPAALLSIFKEAFRVKAAAGGLFGYGIGTAMRIGISRGVFTNEAGIGTSVFANDQNESPEPISQGCLAMFAVFMDTIVMCTLTALVLLVSGVYNVDTYEAAMALGHLGGLADGTELIVQAFARGFGAAGSSFLAILTFVFAFSTLLAWSGFAELAYAYLSGKRGMLFFEFCFLAAIAVGSYASSGIVWELSDMINGGMAAINLTAIAIRAKDVFEYTGRYIDENEKK